MSIYSLFSAKIGATVAVIALSTSCRPVNDDSQTKTLDQLAGSQKIYRCSGEFGGNEVYLPYVRGAE